MYGDQKHGVSDGRKVSGKGTSEAASEEATIVGELPKCSYCGQSQDSVAVLISSPAPVGKKPNSYICDECVAVCTAILEESKGGPKKSAVSLFYSYSHNDEKLRNKLEDNLSILKWQGLIRSWHDRKILAGQSWETEIDKQLEGADIVLFLVSSSFLASDYCYGREVIRALQRHDKGECVVIPIILRPVDWSQSPFAKLQALPRDAKAVTTWKNRDQAFHDIAIGIRGIVEARQQNH